MSQRHFWRFIEDNTIGDNAAMAHDDEIAKSVAWLSHICAYWVWEKDAHNIIQYAKHYKGDEKLNDKSVIDIIFAARKYRKLTGEEHMTDKERQRFSVFSQFRKNRGSFRYPIMYITSPVTGHVMEYINGRKLVARVDG